MGSLHLQPLHGYAYSGYSLLGRRHPASRSRVSHPFTRIAAILSTEGQDLPLSAPGSSNGAVRSLESQNLAASSPEYHGDVVAPSSTSVLVESPRSLLGVKDYMERAPELISGSGSGSDARWFCPLESGKPVEGSPLLLFLPGMDGTGLGMIRHFESLGRMFEVRCLHIPTSNRTPFEGLIKIVEEVIKSESSRAPSKPIYLVGDSFGGALALAVASRNPKVDLILVLANPSTSFGNSQLQPILPLLDFFPNEIYQAIPYFLSFIMGDPVRMALATVERKLPDVDKAQALRDNLVGLLPTLPVLADIIPKETLLWKIDLLKSAAMYTNSRLHAVEADVLLLVSGKDQMLPSREEAERLKKTLKKCIIRYYKDSGHTLLLEDGLDLATVIRGAKFYRRARTFDAVSDFIYPTKKEFEDAYERNKLLRTLTSPVFLSKSEDGKIVRGLSGIPEDRPILLIGYHMLMGLELSLLVSEFLKYNRLVRGVAHPILFASHLESGLSEPGFNDDVLIFGGLPATKMSFIKALAKGESVLLYPGGAREALHRKGETYKLFWPKHAEFVRAAARYGATIVPFGCVGEDDIVELLADYNDIRRVPFLWDKFKDVNTDAIRLRRGETGEVAEQDLFLPLLAPKVPPGRMYFLFGKPFRTEGKEHLLKDKEAAEEVYYDVKREVEGCIEYLVMKREEDPYRSFWPRIIYESAANGNSQAPTFEF